MEKQKRPKLIFEKLKCKAENFDNFTKSDGIFKIQSVV